MKRLLGCVFVFAALAHGVAAEEAASRVLFAEEFDKELDESW
jgi:hypothetical protein